MRMRIGLGYAAVRGPAGVADADMAAQAGCLGCVFHLLYTAHTAHTLNHALLRAHRNTGRIIAPILQPLQAVGEKIHHILLGAHRAHNTAHCKVLLSVGLPAAAAAKNRADYSKPGRHSGSPVRQYYLF